MTCSACLSSILIKYARSHKCSVSEEKKSGKQLAIEGMKLEARIHEKANVLLKEDICPLMKNDEISRTAKHDELIVLVGNHFADKFQPHQY